MVIATVWFYSRSAKEKSYLVNQIITRKCGNQHFFTWVFLLVKKRFSFNDMQEGMLCNKVSYLSKRSIF